jgi:uncharacterized membrane protein
MDARLARLRRRRGIIRPSETTRGIAKIVTRGTVTFEPLGAEKTLVRVSMSYQAEGAAEQVGSMAGLDARRVRADLERFKELVESRGQETGAWRGEIEAGQTKA